MIRVRPILPVRLTPAQQLGVPFDRCRRNFRRFEGCTCALEIAKWLLLFAIASKARSTPCSDPNSACSPKPLGGLFSEAHTRFSRNFRNSLLRADVSPIFCHRATHGQHETDQQRTDRCGNREDVEVSQRQRLLRPCPLENLEGHVMRQGGVASAAEEKVFNARQLVTAAASSSQGRNRAHVSRKFRNSRRNVSCGSPESLTHESTAPHVLPWHTFRIMPS